MEHRLTEVWRSVWIVVVSMFAGLDSIRDCIAFPKNNSGRDVMLNAPSVLAESQLEELCIKVNPKN